MKFSIFSKSLFSSQSGNEAPVDNKTQSLCILSSLSKAISELLIVITFFEIKLIPKLLAIFLSLFVVVIFKFFSASNGDEMIFKEILPLYLLYNAKLNSKAATPPPTMLIFF